MTPRARRIAQGAVAFAFFAVVAWLLGDELRDLDAREIAAALRALSPAQVTWAIGLTAACYMVVASYDRLASRYARVQIPTAIGFAIPFVSYAFNFNLGAIVGAIGFRYRLYSRVNVGAKRIGEIVAFSIATNWCGCLTVLGALLLADPSALQIGWDVSEATSRLFGLLALLPVAAYLTTTRVRRAPVRIRGSHYRVPQFRVALAQVALASTYWLLVPWVLYALRPSTVAIGYSQLALAYSLAAVAGVVIRVPAGLGVIEAVFLEIFRDRVGAGPILGMLIAWRAVYLLAPLGVAAIVLAVLEHRSRSGAGRWRRRGRRASQLT